MHNTETVVQKGKQSSLQGKAGAKEELQVSHQGKRGQHRPLDRVSMSRSTKLATLLDWVAEK